MKIVLFLSALTIALGIDFLNGTINYILDNPLVGAENNMLTLNFNLNITLDNQCTVLVYMI